MNKFTVYRSLAVIGLAFGLAISQSSDAYAIDMVLQGELIGKGSMLGKVQYVIYDKQIQTFSAYIQGANPGDIYVVAVRRPGIRSFAHKLAWFRPDKSGKAIVDLNTKFHPMPYLQPNDVIEIWYGNERVMYGTIR